MARHLIPTASAVMLVTILLLASRNVSGQGNVVPSGNLNDIGRQTTLFSGANPQVWGSKSTTRVGNPEGLCSDHSANYYLLDNNRVTRVAASDFSTTLIAGTGTAGVATNAVGTSANLRPVSCNFHNDNLFLSVSYTNVMKLDLSDANFPVTNIAGDGTNGCSSNVLGASASLQAGALTFRAADNTVYLGSSGCRRIAAVDIADANHPVSWFAGSTQGTADGHRLTTALMDSPDHPVLSPDGSKLYFFDTQGNMKSAIRVVDFTTDLVSTLLTPKGNFAVVSGGAGVADWNSMPSGATFWGNDHLAFVEQMDGVVGLFDINSNTVSFPIGRPNPGAFMNMDGPATIASMNGPVGVVPIISGVSQETTVFGEGLIYGQAFAAVLSVMTLPTASMTISETLLEAPASAASSASSVDTSSASSGPSSGHSEVDSQSSNHHDSSEASTVSTETLTTTTVATTRTTTTTVASTTVPTTPPPTTTQGQGSSSSSTPATTTTDVQIFSNELSSGCCVISLPSKLLMTMILFLTCVFFV